MIDAAGKPDGAVRRVQRFEKEIRSLLATKIIRDFGNSLGFLTVTKVKVTSDLKLARIYISILGEQVDNEASLEALDNHRHEFQHYLGRELKAKYVPKLEFYLDDTFAEVARIGTTLKNLKSADVSEDAPDSRHESLS